MSSFRENDRRVKQPYTRFEGLFWTNPILWAFTVSGRSVQASMIACRPVMRCDAVLTTPGSLDSQSVTSGRQ